MERLGRTDALAAWVAVVGLCHGLFVPDYDEARAEHEFALLEELLSG